MVYSMMDALFGDHFKSQEKVFFKKKKGGGGAAIFTYRNRDANIYTYSLIMFFFNDCI